MPDIALWDSKGSVLTSWLQRIKFDQIGHDTFLKLLLFKKLPVSAFGRQVIDLNGSKTNKLIKVRIFSNRAARMRVQGSLNML